MAVPILFYGTELWGFENSNMIVNWHVQFCETILKVSKITTYRMIYDELCRIPLHIFI